MDEELKILTKPTRANPVYDDGSRPSASKRRKKRRHGDKVRLTGVTNLSYENEEKDHKRKDAVAPEMSGRADSVGNMSTGTYVIDTDNNQDVEDGRSSRKIQRIHKNESLSRTSDTMKKLKIDSRVSMYHAKKDLNRASVVGFVKKKFKSRVCCDYVQDPDPKNKNMCKCGRDIEWHVKSGVVVNLHNSDQPWYPDNNTKQVPCTSFGEISFLGFGRESSLTAPYLRIDAFDTRYDDVLRLMTEYWNVTPPKLIIGITGGAKQFHWKKRLLDTFKTGIINAAKSTSAWLISGGMDAGVMKNVGQAVQDHLLSTGAGQSNIVALGVATWGYIGNREALEGEDSEGLFPAVYNAEDLGPRVTPLNPGHTHFILVDDGTDGQYGKEIDFWTGFQHYISEKMETKIMQEQTVRVPVVVLVLEGGPNTLKTTASSIANGTPIVVIQDSGRCADFIATGFRLSKPKPGSEDSNFPSDFDETMMAVAQQVFDNNRMKAGDVKKYVQSLKAILSDRKYITIFSLDDETTTNDIDKAILHALLKANRSSAYTQLSLALAWNRCDIAREQIFTADNRKQWQSLHLSDALFTALVQNRVDFVQLFLDMGVNLKKFLTVRRLRDLYEKVLQDKFAGNSRDLLKNMLSTLNIGFKYYLYCGNLEDDVLSDRRHLLSNIGILICMLLGYQVPNMYSGEHYEVDESEKPKSSEETYYFLTPRRTYQESQFKKISGGNLMQTANDTLVFCTPERDLLLWAVLLNRRELAMLFWRMGLDHVGGALLSSSILKSLSGEADDAEEVDLSNDLTNHSKDFENLANGVLTECYSKNKGLTHLCLIRNMSHWGNVTCLTIADTGEHMDFMGHSACQTRLNKIWRGRMAMYTSNLKILLGLFFPIVVWWIKFSTKDSPVYELLDDRENQDRNDDGKISQKEKEEDVEEELEDQAALGNKNGNQGRRNLFTVTLTGRGKNSISFHNALIYFYTAPVTKFLLTSFFYLFFMALFSYFVLTDLHPLGVEGSPSVPEFIIWLWVTTLIVEEVRQLAMRDTRSLKFKARSWYSNYWNRFDFILYVLFVTAVVTRCVFDQTWFYIARSFYAVTIGMFFLRFMQVFYAHKDIGPKVIMIRRMMTDVFFFLCILSVFVAAYGISSQAILYPNADGGAGLFKSLFRTPFWQMYGELFIEHVEGDPPENAVCSFDPSVWRNSSEVVQCPVKSELTPFLFAAYMILTNVLLLNLLIAMFSYTFQNVQENSDLVWRYYRHDLVYEYFDRPPLVAPLIIFSHLFRLSWWLVDKCRKKPQAYNTAFCIHLSKDHNIQVTAFERVGMEQYLVKFRLEDRDHINTKVSTTATKIEKVILDLEQIKETVVFKPKVEEEVITPSIARLLTTDRMESREDSQNLNQRLLSLEGQMTEILRLLQDPRRQCRCEERPRGDGQEERGSERHSERHSDADYTDGSDRARQEYIRTHDLRRRSGRQNIQYSDRARFRASSEMSQIPAPVIVARDYGDSRGQVSREYQGSRGQGHRADQRGDGGFLHSMFEEPSVTITDVDST